MKLNKAGEIVQREWEGLPKRFSYLLLGAFIVMPNHFHGILIFHEPVVATRLNLNEKYSSNRTLPITVGEDIHLKGSPLPHGPKSASLGAVIAQFKSHITKRLWKIPSLKGTPIWQRNYYEHIIRNEKDLKNKTAYINANPMLWEGGDEHPFNLNKSKEYQMHYS